MKKNITTLLAVALAIGLTSCGDKESTANSAPADNYPIDVCVVSGKPLGSMGLPHVIDYKGTTVKFCCDGCLPKFNSDPEKFLAKLKTGE